MTFQEELNLSEVEEKFWEASKDITKTKRRIKSVLIAKLLFVISLCAFAFLTRSYLFVLGIALLHVILTLYEAIGYGNGVIVYKTLIQKLIMYIEKKPDIRGEA